MACPYAVVFRLSPPLAAHSCIRLAIRSGQSHPVSWTQAQPSDWDRIATALSGYGHSTAKEEHVPSVTLPPDVAACHRAVRRHTCSPVTRRPSRARQAQAAPGAHAGQSAPKTPAKRATRLATGPRSAWAARSRNNGKPQQIFAVFQVGQFSVMSPVLCVIVLLYANLNISPEMHRLFVCF